MTDKELFEIRPCVKCKYHRIKLFFGYSFVTHLCTNPKYIDTRINRVTGKMKRLFQECVEIRRYDTECSNKGTDWIPKDKKLELKFRLLS